MRLLLLVLFGLAASASAQDGGWDWGWTASEPWAEDALLHELDLPEGSFAERAIGYYQRDVVPVMDRPCPAWPSCSMYTRYSMARFGFLPGLLMGVDRMFFRENRAFVDGEGTAFTFRLDGRSRVYDPPDANVASLLRDWRQLHPDYRARFHPAPRPAERDRGRLGVHIPDSE